MYTDLQLDSYFIYDGCISTTAYEYLSPVTRLCQDGHKSNSIVTLRRPLCIYDGCTATAYYGYPDTKEKLYCKLHKTDNNVNLSVTLCIHEGCTVTASYGYPGTKKSLYCTNHKDDDNVGTVDSRFSIVENSVVNLMNKMCIHEGCTVIASFGYPDTKKRLYCVSHKEDDMIRLINNKKRKRTDV